jgi:hypothetical protein
VPLRRQNEALELLVIRRAPSGLRAVALALAACLLVAGLLLFLMMPDQRWDFRIGSFRLVGTQVWMVTGPVSFSYRPSGFPGVLCALRIGEQGWIAVDNNRAFVAAYPDSARKR